MPKRRVAVLQNEEEWNHFLIEAFEDTPSKPQILRTPQEILPELRGQHPEVVFVNQGLLTPAIAASLHVSRSSDSDFRAFALTQGSARNSLYPFDETFQGSPPTLSEFQRRLAEHLPLPDPVRLLVVDDEPEIGALFRDYFDHRTGPSFILETARNGLEAEEKIRKAAPHVMVLDIKMPERDGRELYRELQKKGITPPTIVFFDAVSVDEVVEIRRMGNPAFVEKGSRASALPEMAPLIKKLAYFG